MFFPNDQARVGAPPNKTRAFRYSLCKRCVRKVGSVDRAERIIFDATAALTRCNCGGNGDGTPAPGSALRRRAGRHR
jgi:hypothetical protein